MTMKIRGKQYRCKSLKLFGLVLIDGAVKSFPIADSVRFWKTTAGVCGPLARGAGALGLLLSEGLIPGLVLTIIVLSTGLF